MNRIAADIIELSRAVRITERNGFIVGAAKVVVDEGREAAERALSEALYQHHYCRPAPSRARPVGQRADLIALYTSANTGRGTMEAGWKLIRREADGTCVAERYGIRFWVKPEHISREGGAPLDPGADVRVRVPNASPELVPGFYLFVGDAPGQATGTAETARLYFHLREAGGPTFVATLSTILNRAAIPFRAKILREPGTFVRADAAVLYLERDLLARAFPELRAIYIELRPFLRESTPMFALRVAPGLAIADDPGDLTSFGQHRCAVAARGLLASYVDQPPTEEQRVSSVARAFVDAGLCPRRTHLRSADAKPYPRFAWQKSSKQTAA